MPAVSILLADDSENERYLLRLMAERSGATVVGEAADGRAAIELAGQLQPDLVLLDLAMPVMTGIEALPSIIAVAPHSRVVILSHFPSSQMRHHTDSLGAVGYVEKSTPRDRLLDEVFIAAGLLDVVTGALQQHAAASFEPTTESARSARRFVDHLLRQWHCDELVDNVALLVSELVTNVIEHAASDLDVAVKLLRDRLRVEVFDRSPVTPHPREPDPEATSGRGLLIVDALADAWGVDGTDDGKCVWFELARPGG